MITFKCKGNYKKANSFFEKMLNIVQLGNLDKYGLEGVEALKEATPKDTGKTSRSWSYEIVRKKGKVSIIWSNDNVEDGRHIAVILQYGYATRNGGYVQGRDYINPALAPVFDKIAEDAWKEITKV